MLTAQKANELACQFTSPEVTDLTKTILKYVEEVSLTGRTKLNYVASSPIGDAVMRDLKALGYTCEWNIFRDRIRISWEYPKG